MSRVRKTSFNPSECKVALARASSAVIDLETTGVAQHNKIVAAGVLIDREAFILIVNSHLDLSGHQYWISERQLRDALMPLSTNLELRVAFHNAAFDLAMLHRHGIQVNCSVDDTMKMLKLVDSDRGREQDDGYGTGSLRPRFQRRYQQSMNYRLKDVVRHLLNIGAEDFPGAASALGFDDLVSYLKSDLIVTESLYEHLKRRMRIADRQYNDRLIVPVTSLLACMSASGVSVDAEFIDSESDRLERLLHEISDTHRKRFGTRLNIGDFALRGWVYFDRHGLRCRIIKSGKKQSPSLRTQDLRRLRREASSKLVKESLALIHDYHAIRSLMVRLRSLAKHVNPNTQRVYSTFNDFQTSGRISSTRPNLQQLANALGGAKGRKLLSSSFSTEEVVSRNAIVASDGHRLVGFDIAQADIRVLAHATEAFPAESEQYLESLHEDRLARLPGIDRYRQRMWKYFQPQNKKRIRCPHCNETVENASEVGGQTIACQACSRLIEIPSKLPTFDPSVRCVLADDFRNATSDFYTVAAERMLKRRPEKKEREHLKRTILGVVNGMSAGGLAKQLGVRKNVAAGYLERFANCYPKVAAYTALTKHAFAITGESTTLCGRRRIVSPHRWMATESVVEIFVSYRNADKLWMRVVPLRPNRFTLTCWVLEVVDARYGSKNEGLKIYDHMSGRISQAKYKFFDDRDLVFRLPVRNIPWRLVRTVRTKAEESRYEGYDKTWRQLLNHVAQGGTADIAKTMMLRADPVCQRYDARLLLQIHDELVFEVPAKRADRFTREINRELLRAPTANFKVPIVLTPKVGPRFGEMTDIAAAALSDYWIVRFGHYLKRMAKSLWGKLWLQS